MRYQISSYELLCKMLKELPPGNACLEWPRGRFSCGYGTITKNGKHEAHRLAYELTFGPIPAGMFVCHKCDNRLCFRRDHMVLGTHTDNMRDCVAKRRHGSQWHSFSGTTVPSKRTDFGGLHERLTSYELLKELLKTIPEADTCVEWTRGKFSDGYGLVRLDGKLQKTHRVAYELTKGPIPTDHVVCHSCDNPICVRPSHLFVGTPAENNLDKLTKGRSFAPRGIKHGGAKLTEAQVHEIRALAAQGIAQREIARRFKIGQNQVSEIHRRVHWKHI